MTPWELPASLNIGGVERPIRTDFRAILDILKFMSSKKYEEDEKKMIFFEIMFPGFEDIPPEDYEEAAKKAVEFMDMGLDKDTDRKKPTTMNWEKDAPIIIPAVSRVMGKDPRTVPYDVENNTGGIHWWTFLGAYMEIGESLFSSVLNIRQKKAKGKRLEKYEQEFYRENKKLVELESANTQRSQEEQDAIAALLG